MPAAELPTLPFASEEDWDAWLAENHAASDGLWIKIAKKASGVPTVAYPGVLDVAISYGWIDGQRRALDDTWFLQKFTPRRARSRWSRINRDRAVALIEAGRMKQAGLREVERAKADGRWDAAYESPRNISVPEDLQRELDADPRAREFFEGLDSQNRYAILYRLQDAKRPETRARRLAQFVEMLREGRKLHP
ncbi:MAG: hypothetical protein QOG41_2222 [Thermoleophilaceae bacterium]|nr:hypothetical protein [Thermoleophilaceae bacterium]